MVKLLTDRIAEVALTVLIAVVAFLSARSFDLTREVARLQGEMAAMRETVHFTRGVVMKAITHQLPPEAEDED